MVNIPSYLNLNPLKLSINLIKGNQNQSDLIPLSILSKAIHVPFKEVRRGHKVTIE